MQDIDMARSRRMQRAVTDALEDEDTSRTMLLIGGGALALFGLTRLSPLGLLLAAAGGGLAYLGTRHRSIADLSRQALEMAPGIGQEGVVTVERVINIHRSPEDVYGFWRDFHNLERFMTHIESVDITGPGDRRSHWRAHLFEGSPTIEWDAEMLSDERPYRIAWKSVPGSPVDTSGEVRFQSVSGGRGCQVHLRVEYRLPAGGATTKVLNPALGTLIKQDLANLKDILEGREQARETVKTRTEPPRRFDFE